MKKRTLSRRLGAVCVHLLALSGAACVQNSAAQPSTPAMPPELGAAVSGSPTRSTALLTAHNQWRAKVGTPALQWSASLTDMAQQWADRLVAEGCVHRHSGVPQYGENIFFASPVTWSDGRTEPQTVTPQHVVDDWGNESKNYDYASNSCASICGHYTQVVWRDTREVGCGMAMCPDNSQIWVCNYYPVGNVGDEKPY